MDTTNQWVSDGDAVQILALLEALQESKHFATHTLGRRGSHTARTRYTQQQLAGHASASQQNFRQLQDDAREAMLSLYQRWKTDREEAQKNPKHVVQYTDAFLAQGFKRTLRTLYYRGYRLGMRASAHAEGVQASGMLQPRDRAWIESALRHEFRFLNKMVTAITTDTWKMPIPQRIGMYVDAANAVFHAGKANASPSDVAFWWETRSKEPCASCQLLKKYSPYTRKTLPTTPCAGATICLTNCKCGLRTEKITAADARRIEREALSKHYLLRRVLKAKRDG